MRRYIPTIKAVMTPFPYAVDQDESMDVARNMMGEHRIHHLPVTADKRLVGVISQRDLDLSAALLDVVGSGKIIKVKDVCRFDPFSVTLEEPLDGVLEQMAAQHIGSVLVTKNERLVGIFTTTDACRCYAEFLQTFLQPSNPEPEEPDAA